jgi:alkane 1-monooxygenase
MATTSLTALRYKKYAFLLAFVALLSPIIGWYLSLQLGYNNVFAWFSLILLFGVVPIIDFIVGKDPVNPDESQVAELSEEKYYRWITLLAIPVLTLQLVWAGWVLHHWDLSLLGQIGLIMSLGAVNVSIGITVGHELVHKDALIENAGGGFLWALFCYAGFKVEHVRGHHVTVSTPEDASSSRYGQSLYAFLPHAYLHNFLNSWKLEAKRLTHKGHSPFSWRNELIWWNGLSVLVAIGFYMAFGPLGLALFLGQAFVAFTFLEVINYVEHYGLHRRKLENGRYERVTPKHSWNANDRFTNLLLFHLQRHSDHHANPKRRYQVLRHFDESPQLPTGYAGMFLLAWFPPLWFKVMNPRVEAYYAGEEHQLTQNQTRMQA